MNVEFDAKDFAKAITLIDETEFMDMSSGKPQPISTADSILLKATMRANILELLRIGLKERREDADT